MAEAIVMVRQVYFFMLVYEMMEKRVELRDISEEKCILNNLMAIHDYYIVSAIVLLNERKIKVKGNTFYFPICNVMFSENRALERGVVLLSLI